jgi:hypothetical protein
MNEKERRRLNILDRCSKNEGTPIEMKMNVADQQKR